MVSIPKSVPNLKHRSASTETDSNGSWDMSIQHLSESLSQICSSPTQAHGNSSFHEFMKNRSSGSHLSNHSSNSSITENLSGSPTDKLEHPVFSKSGRKCKKIRVRHEESKRKLHEQLVAIIGNGKVHNDHCDAEIVEEEEKTSPRRPSRPDIKREDMMRRSFKLDVNLDSVLPEQLSVQVTDDLSVYSCVNDTHDRLASVELSDDLDVESVMCSIVDNKVLEIKQYPAKYLELDYPQFTAQYLPIMHQDDGLGTWRLILHIPACYYLTTSAINVKTVDEKLHITWNCDGFSPRQCKVTLELPPMVQSRSVSGVITEDNQLILEALLGRKRNRCLTL